MGHRHGRGGSSPRPTSNGTVPTPIGTRGSGQRRQRHRATGYADRPDWPRTLGDGGAPGWPWPGGTMTRPYRLKASGDATPR